MHTAAVLSGCRQLSLTSICETLRPDGLKCHASQQLRKTENGKEKQLLLPAPSPSQPESIWRWIEKSMDAVLGLG